MSYIEEEEAASKQTNRGAIISSVRDASKKKGAPGIAKQVVCFSANHKRRRK